jgi:hypothetical protein
MGQTTKGSPLDGFPPVQSGGEALVQGEHAAYAVGLEVLNVEAAQAERHPTAATSDDARTQVTVRIGRSEVIATREPTPDVCPAPLRAPNNI